ncbi:hypothetical protein [Microbacterium lacticum]
MLSIGRVDTSNAGLAWAFLTNRADRTSVDIDELDNAIIGGL